MVPGVQDTIPGSRIISEGGPTAMSINSAATGDEADTIRNLKPPEMITEGSQFSLYEKRLRRWSRLSSLSPQLQFDLILSTVPISNPLCEKLEEEVGDSSEAQSKGVDVIIEKLKEWFGKQEDIDAFMHYKEFECKIRSPSQMEMEVSNGSNKCLLVSCDENSEDEHYARKLTSFLYGQSRLDSVPL